MSMAISFIALLLTASLVRRTNVLNNTCETRDGVVAGITNQKAVRELTVEITAVCTESASRGMYADSNYFKRRERGRKSYKHFQTLIKKPFLARYMMS